MVYLHVSTNVGSLGRGDGEWDPNDVSEVRRAVYDLFSRIKQEHGKYPDSLGIQEAGNLEVELGPQFEVPIASDEHVVQVKNGVNIRRGVVTYAKDPETVVWAPVDTVTEMVTTVHRIRFSNGRGNKDHKVAILNIYRLNHKSAVGTSLGELKRAIAKQVRTLELQGIHKVLIHGDFNNVNLSIPGFRELNHKGMYHRHKEGSAKRYIDKVFANFGGSGSARSVPIM